MQNQQKYNAVLHAAHLLLRSMPHAAEQFGVALNKNPNTIRNELNPCLPGHKLGMLDALEMMNMSESYGLLYQLNAACGFMAIPLPKQVIQEQQLIDGLCLWQSAVGAACQTIYEAIEDDVITTNEFNAISNAGNHKMSQWFHVQETLRKRSELDYGN